MTIFVTYFSKYVTYFLTFMDGQSFVLVEENFHGYSFYFNFKVYNVKIQFFLQCSKLESLLSEKTHLLDRHSKIDNGNSLTSK